jgi:uncharacterized protein (TIGR03435 family)
MSADPGRLIYTNVSLSDVIEKAYGVQHNQILAPAWFDTERYDIAAKIPSGIPYIGSSPRRTAPSFGRQSHQAD